MKLAVIGGGAGSDGCVAWGGRRVVDTTVGVTGALVIGRMPTCIDDAGRTERPELPESDREPSVAHSVNPNGSKRG